MFETHTFKKGGLHSSLWDFAGSSDEYTSRGKPEAFKLLDELPEHGLTIVGTRRPQLTSIELTKKSVRALRGQKIIILSGLAFGIDAAAHEAALESDIRTIAVLGCGVNFCYPRSNQAIYDRILNQGGLIASPFPNGTTPYPSHFLKRNATLAGWAKAVVMIEASYRSGALNTARWARESARDCFTVPCYPGDSIRAGNQKLLETDGALPFWGVHSLGSVCLELATLSPQSPSKKAAVSDDTRKLTVFIEESTQQLGGVSVQALFDWAYAQNWSSERFYLALRQAQTLEFIADRNGLFSYSI